MYQFNNGIDDYDLYVLPVHKVKPLNIRIKVTMAATVINFIQIVNCCRH